jgi:hypothetical protein
MSQNQEIIEARLCAYIDDELDATGRAELEKHLASTPQHQRLIEELRLTSGLVRNLPRESAPPDLAEGFNAQLERSVLLAGVSEDVAAADLKTPRWPQLVAMAAITLLTVGLAVVVYFALPTGAHPPIVQILPHASNTAVALADRDGSVSDEQLRAVPRSTADKRAADEPLADADKLSSENVPSAPAPAAAPEAPLAASSPVAQLPADQLTMANAPVELGRKLLDNENARRAAAGERTAPIVLVMHADDPAAARKALVVYLVQQDIAWEPTQGPAPLGAVAEREEAKDVNRARFRALGGAVASTQPDSSMVPAPAEATGAGGGQANAADGAKQIAAASAGIVATQPTTNPANAPSAFGASAGALATAATQPSFAQASPPVLEKALQEQKEDVSQSHGARFSGAIASAAVAEFSVSCKLSAEQAEALRASLQQPGTTIDPLPGPIAATSNEQNLNKDALAKEQQSIVEQKKLDQVPTDGKAALAPSPVAALPATNPATAPSLDAADSTPAAVPPPALPTGFSDAAAATQNGAAYAAGPATQPAVASAPLLEVVIVVRPTDQPTASSPSPNAPSLTPASPAPAAPTTQQ